ncbi:MAG: hypothetical protein IT360_15090 [Gemmatimonadaceae bacterium]|nr:hypothetical protein [Gemmatimonadaceae bacterium]
MITVHRKTNRGMLVITEAGSPVNNTLRQIADVLEFPALQPGSFAETLMGKFIPATDEEPDPQDISIATEEAARYSGSENSFRIKVLYGTAFPSDSLSADEKAAVREVGYKTIAASVFGYALNVLGADKEIVDVNPLTYPCIRDGVVIAAKATPELAQFMGRAVRQTTSHGADTALIRAVIQGTGDCMTDIADAGIKEMAKKVSQRAAGLATTALAGGFKAVLELGSLGMALEAVLPTVSGSNMQTWTVHQSWMSDLIMRQTDTSNVVYNNAVGTTMSIVPFARLADKFIPLPGDVIVTHDTVGGASYLASPHRFAGRSSGVGNMHASWLTSAGGSRNTKNESVTFCGLTSTPSGPSGYRLVVLGYGGSTSNKTTVNIDTLSFRAEMQLSCAPGWTEYPYAVITATTSTGDPGPRAQTAIVAGSTSYKRLWFVGSGGSFTFQATFRNPLAGNAVLPGGYSPTVTQTIGRGVVMNITPTVTNLYFRAGASAQATWTGEYIDVNNQVRNQSVCFKGVGQVPPTGTCWTSLNFSSFGIDKQVMGYSSTDPYALGQVVKVNAYQIQP